jgi:hypothetical protein
LPFFNFESGLAPHDARVHFIYAFICIFPLFYILIIFGLHVQRYTVINFSFFLLLETHKQYTKPHKKREKRGKNTCKKIQKKFGCATQTSTNIATEADITMRSIGMFINTLCR